MTKEEICEKYWKKLVEIRPVYQRYRIDTDHMCLMYEAYAEKERVICFKACSQTGFQSPRRTDCLAARAE